MKKNFSKKSKIKNEIKKSEIIKKDVRRWDLAKRLEHRRVEGKDQKR
ncbi:MAG: hypothetical protein PHO28_04025 [Candidatus Pacebacteria bacterium]|nr:hypothetical protein [Candidatus Paceibacterota bacterium]